MHTLSCLGSRWIGILGLLLLFAAVGCATPEEEAVTPEAAVTPTPTATLTPVPFPADAADIDFVTIAIDAPSRFRAFADIDEFGRVQGFDADVIADIAAQTDIDYEFVVTAYDGLLQSVAQGEFDAAMSALVIPDEPEEGIAYTRPYLEVGQVLVVRANDRAISGPEDISDTTLVGVQRNTSGEQTARDIMILPETNLVRYDTTPQALQALIDREVDVVVIDSDDAEQYTENYYQQLKIAGGEGEEAWITRKGYGIAVAAENQALLSLLNEAIRTAHADGTIARLTRAWLIPQERIIAGEPLTGTLDKEFVIGMVAPVINMDPAADPDPVGWELQMNTLGGLLMYTADSQLVPILAEDFPAVSPDRLEYTFRLRPGLTFPDGSEFTAEDVKWSLNRSARFGNFLVNAFLKDANVDGFADDDAVQVVDPQTVKIILDEPTSYFPSLLATPPYYVISESCYAADLDPQSMCGGIGPYTITDWEAGQQMRLKANPQWPGPPPAFENVQVRFYDGSAPMRRSLEIGAIDVAWIGLSLDDITELRADPDYREWQSPARFKSYLVFEQSTFPWGVEVVRQAAAYAVDREALAELFQGARAPLYSPVPDGVPGHLATEPPRDLEEARELLSFAGYTPENPLPITISYVSDGRYSPFESEYALLLKQQLEETDVFQVTLAGAPYDAFRQQSATCNAPAFILGWPPSGQPPYYVDPSHWINYFIFNTDTLCSNYRSEEMNTLVSTLDQLDPNDWEARKAVYEQIQALWAEEYPTLDLTQEVRIAISLSKVQSVKMDALGLMHYGALMKGGSSAGEG